MESDHAHRDGESFDEYKRERAQSNLEKSAIIVSSTRLGQFGEERSTLKKHKWTTLQQE